MSYPIGTPSWRRYLRFWRRDPQSDIDAELRFHFDARIDDLIALGHSAESARTQAEEEFGDVTAVRERLNIIGHRLEERRRRRDWLDGIRQDAAYSARSLARSPAFAVTIVLTLALGLGVNTALFSLLDVLYLRPPAGVVNPDGVQRVWKEGVFVDRGRMFSAIFDYPTYRAARDALGQDAATAIYTWPSKVPLSPDPNGPTAIVSFASASFFDLLGVRAQTGRTYDAGEDRFGSPSLVAVVSDDYWRRSLDASPTVVGSKIGVGTRQFTIIGVAPPRFTGVDLSATDIWIPLAARLRNPATPWWERPNPNGMAVLIRARSGFGAPQIEPRLTRATHAPALIRRAEDTLNVVRLGSIIMARGPGDLNQEMRIATRLGGVAVLVLVIACANVVNLLLARGVRRRREIAVRLALGISRPRLLRLLVVESVILSLLSVAGAIVAAYWGGSILRALLLPDVHWVRSPVHWRVLLYALGVGITAGVLSGLLPAMQSLSPDVAGALKSGGREGTPQRSRLRGSLVAMQAAISVVLLVGAALFIRSLQNVRNLDIGFDAERLAFAYVAFPTPDSARDARVGQLLRELADRLRSAPGVERVALTHVQPMWGLSWLGPFYPEADTIRHKFDEAPTFFGVSGDYFATTGTRVLRGRVFPASGSVGQEVVINEAFANTLWPRENPIGRCIRFLAPDAPCYSVIGVVETARQSRIIEEAKAQYYLPLDRMPSPNWAPGAIVVRSDPRVRSLVVGEIRRTIQQQFPGGYPMIQQMSEIVEPQYRPWKLGAALFTLFGALALVVAAVGIYSTVSYTVNQRTHEFGVRIALGARVVDILRHVLADGLRTVVAGVAFGIVLALAAGRLIASLLYGVAPSDPVVMIVISTLLIAIAIAAALSPAWRAARVDPVTALRAD
jgi:predicted permease